MSITTISTAFYIILQRKTTYCWNGSRQ